VTKLSTGWVQAPRVRTEGVARDQGDVILSWLTRIVVGIAVTAVIGFDSLSIAVTHVSAKDDANAAAVAASQAWRAAHGDADATLHAAEISASEHGETVIPDSVTADPDGTIHLRIRHEASTLLVRHLGPWRSWAQVVVKGSGRSAP
jgi:hypothetical protein